MMSGAMTYLRRPAVIQFIKFCIVGASSFLIDFLVSTSLTYTIFHHHWVIPRIISFTLAVTNGFIWNQRWTFHAVGKRRSHEQYTMFYIVNIVGLLLNLGIMKTVFYMSKDFLHTWSGSKIPFPIWLSSFLIATTIVTFWNFFANKHWTFTSK